MGKYHDLYAYELARLKDFCAEIEVNTEIIESGIELNVLLTGDGQVDIFGNSNDSRVLITTAVDTRVQTEGKLDIGAADLKKIIKLVERAGRAFFIAFREEILEKIDSGK